MVGPEMSETKRDLHLPQSAPSLTTHLFRGTAIEFFRASLDLLQANTFVAGCNCGFGNWENPLPRRYDLLFEWIPDLYFLTATRLPCLFLCANDYADLAGETAVMQRIMGCQFTLEPAENPFSYARYVLLSV